MNLVLVFLLGAMVGCLTGIVSAERSIRIHPRKWAKLTGHCYMCDDCPDGCPMEYPEDPKNK